MIGADFESAVMDLQQRMADGERQRVNNVRDAARMVEELFARLTESANTWQHSAQQSTRDIASSLAAAERLQTAMHENNSLLRQWLNEERQLLDTAVALPGGMPALEPLLSGVADGRGVKPSERPGLFSRWLGRRPRV